MPAPFAVPADLSWRSVRSHWSAQAEWNAQTLVVKETRASLSGNEITASATLNLRGGWRLSKTASLTVILENLLDVNYRVMGSGVDGPGFNLVVRFSTAVF